MNIIEQNVLQIQKCHGYVNQQSIIKDSHYSHVSVGRALKSLKEAGFLDEAYQVTDKANALYEEASPRRAIILAAGFGMRMVPINTETPKALVEVKGEILIERLIMQLHEVGITDITIVVGFMKEKFEYLIDQFQVKLMVNPAYATKNNLHSLKCAIKKIDHCYIVPSDLWCRKNPFCAYENHSWYMVSDKLDEESVVKVNRKEGLTLHSPGNQAIGICYLTGQEGETVKERVKALSLKRKYDDAFWEEALCDKKEYIVPAKVVSAKDVIEINTYEQLRDLDGQSNQLQSDAIDIIMKALNVSAYDIVDITALKKGMTNRSFLFTCQKQKYIMRIPGEGTDQLINRRQEAAVYQAIDGLGISDDLIYINPDNGYKITKYLDDARVCDADCVSDLEKCMAKLKKFHQLALKVNHEFNIFEKIEFYESLWHGMPSAYRDYAKTKEHVFQLKAYIDEHVEKKCLTHIDAVPDNFLFTKDKEGNEELRLIDWEYAGMQDPHVDIAMFCIYALYEREQVDRLIDIYFENQCTKEIRIKIYCYIAACGLLWSNWCEYKRNLGVEFGEYSLRQYRYAKEYYKIVKEEGMNE